MQGGIPDVRDFQPVGQRGVGLRAGRGVGKWMGIKCAPEEIARVPAHKTLLRCEPGKGLPIGNLNSQFFANFLGGISVAFAVAASFDRRSPGLPSGIALETAST